MALGPSRFSILAACALALALAEPATGARPSPLLAETPLLETPGVVLRHRGGSFVGGVSRADETKARNPRPLVGVVAQPKYWPDDDEYASASDAASDEVVPPPPNKKWYVAASYVKWLESAGARAAPLLPDDPPEVLDAKLASINGVLIPGGDSDVSPGTPLRRLAERVVRESLDAWRERRETFPVWGTCMGFQLAALVVANETSDERLLTAFDDADRTAALERGGAADASEILRAVPKRVLRRVFGEARSEEEEEEEEEERTPRAVARAVANGSEGGDRGDRGDGGDGGERGDRGDGEDGEDDSRAKKSRSVGVGIVYENHSRGVAPSAFASDAGLLATFGSIPIAIGRDRAGAAFTAIVEGSNGAPLYGTQFHPEKAAFEWDPRLEIPRGADAVALGQSLANFFVERARRSKREPSRAGGGRVSEDELVMANHAPTFVGKGGYRGTEFDEVYAL